jgi:hypothetical protein
MTKERQVICRDKNKQEWTCYKETQGKTKQLKTEQDLSEKLKVLRATGLEGAVRNKQIHKEKSKTRKKKEREKNRKEPLFRKNGNYLMLQGKNIYREHTSRAVLLYP